MLDRSYLIRGLDVLASAHTGNYFVDGHKGGAIVAACFLVAEQPVEEGVSDLFAGIIDDCWGPDKLGAPFPEDASDPGLLDRITAALAGSMGQLRQAGHNVILPTLALKAFRESPDAITPARVDGICRLIEAFEETTEIPPVEDDEFPDPQTPEEFSRFALTEVLRCAEAFIGRGQGWTGHMCTFGRAVVDLRRLGYEDLARKGQRDFMLYVKRARMGPLETDKPRAEHPEISVFPLELEYWQARRGSDQGLGHSIKYPYGFYGLMSLCPDADLKRRCLEAAFRIF